MGFSSGPLPSGVNTKTPHKFSSCPVRATSPAHLFVLNHIWREVHILQPVLMPELSAGMTRTTDEECHMNHAYCDSAQIL